ncbi:hypothetical protein D3C73_1609660 [compost metagenome]
MFSALVISVRSRRLVSRVAISVVVVPASRISVSPSLTRLAASAPMRRFLSMFSWWWSVIVPVAGAAVFR